MATTVNSSVNAMANWTYYLPVSGFPDVVQGPDSLGKIFNFDENTKVWFATKQLQFMSSVTYDLTNLSDVFGDTISFTHIFSIMIQCNTGRIYCFMENVQYPFLANFSEAFPIDAGTSFITSTDNILYASIVDATHKNLKIENQANSGTASFKIAIVGKV
jgi:hypothetical protein